MINRIKEVLTYTNMSEMQFAKKLGVTQSMLNRTMRGATEVSYKLLNSILTNFKDISAEWLMRGDGSMLIGEDKAAQDKRIEKLVDVIAMQQEVIQNLQDKIKQLQKQ